MDGEERFIDFIFDCLDNQIIKILKDDNLPELLKNDDNFLFLLRLYTEDIPQIERIKNLTYQGRVCFLFLSSKCYINSVEGTVRRLPAEDKKNLVKQIQERIKNRSEDVLEPLRAMMPKFYMLRVVSLEELNFLYRLNGLPDKDRDFLIDFFYTNLSEKPISDQTMNDCNKVVSWLGERKKPRTPPFEESKDLVEKIKKDPLNDELRKEYIKEYTKKGLTIYHKDIIIEALPEITNIYRAIEGFRLVDDKREKEPKTMRKALQIFDRDPESFLPVKREFLEDKKIYSKLKSAQRIRYFFGELLNKVFKDNGLSTIDKDIIYEELIKTTYWRQYGRLKK